jgi:hypothetical protein
MTCILKERIQKEEEGAAVKQCSVGIRITHELSDIPDVPKSVVTNLWGMENFTLNLFEKKQTLLNIFFGNNFNHGSRNV